MRGEPARDREAVPPRHHPRVDGLAAAERDRRRHADADAPTRARARCRRARSSSSKLACDRRSSTASGGCVTSNAKARSASGVAPRSQTATRQCVVSRSATRTTPALAVERERRRRPAAGRCDAGDLLQQVEGQQRLDAIGERGARKSALLSQFVARGGTSVTDEPQHAAGAPAPGSALRACPRVNQTSRSFTDGSFTLSSYLVVVTRQNSSTFCLTSGLSATLASAAHVWRRGSRRHRGDGVHRCCPRSFRAARGCTPGRRRRILARDEVCSPRRRSEPSAPSPRPRSSSSRRTSMSCTSARPTTCTCRWPRPRWPRASTSSARSRWRSTTAAPRRWSRPRPRAGRVTAVPFVYRYYPTVREARERVRTGVTGPVRLIHGGYLQDWLLRPTTTTGASTSSSAARRAPSPTSARTGATSPSSSPATGSPA